MNALQIFCYSHAVEGFSPFSGAKHALQRTPGFAVRLPGAASGPELLSLGSLDVATHFP